MGKKSIQDFKITINNGGPKSKEILLTQFKNDLLVKILINNPILAKQNNHK